MSGHADVCTWTHDPDEGGWQASCPGSDPWEFPEGGPREHAVRFCLFCGKAVVLVRAADIPLDTPDD